MRKLVLLASLCVVLAGPGAFAHHPFDAEFDRAKPVAISGTVESIEWTNPHASIHMKGKDRRGTMGEWTVEMGGPDELTKAGWTRDTLKVGDMVMVQGWAAKDGSMRVNARAVRTSAGKNLMAASSFTARDRGQVVSQDRQGAATTGAADSPDAAGTAGTSGQLPGTATVLPLAGLAGLLSLGAAVGLYVMRR
jgi:hypothetical protein